MPRVAACWALVVLARCGLCTGFDFPWTGFLEHVQELSDGQMGKVVEMRFTDQPQCQDRVIAKQIRVRERTSVAKPPGSIVTRVAKGEAMREICYAYLLSSKTAMPSVAVYDAKVFDVGVADKNEGPPQLFYYLMAHGGKDLLSKWAPMGPLYEAAHKPSNFFPKNSFDFSKGGSSRNLPMPTTFLRRSNLMSPSARTINKPKINPKVKLALGAALFYQLVSGLKLMQGLGLTHRDIKDENLLVTAFGPSDEPEDLSTAPEHAWRLAFADFGGMAQGKSLPEHAVKGVFGTPGFMSPEYMSGEFCVGCTDVWAAGVVLHDLTFGRGSFAHGRIGLEEETEAVKKTAKVIKERTTLAASPADSAPKQWWHKRVLQMLQWTLQIDAEERMANFDKVLNMAHDLAKVAAEDIGRDLAEWIAPPPKCMNTTFFKSMNRVNSVVGILDKMSVADCPNWKFTY